MNCAACHAAGRTTKATTMCYGHGSDSDFWVHALCDRHRADIDEGFGQVCPERESGTG